APRSPSAASRSVRTRPPPTIAGRGPAPTPRSARRHCGTARSSAGAGTRAAADRRMGARGASRPAPRRRTRTTSRALVTNGSDAAMTANDAPTPATTPSPADGDVDTVEDAATGPDRDQPYAALGLREEEYASIREILGRRPTNAELAMYSEIGRAHV